jgi:hypothetical protein
MRWVGTSDNVSGLQKSDYWRCRIERLEVGGSSKIADTGKRARRRTFTEDTIRYIIPVATAAKNHTAAIKLAKYLPSVQLHQGQLPLCVRSAGSISRSTSMGTSYSDREYSVASSRGLPCGKDVVFQGERVYSNFLISIHLSSHSAVVAKAVLWRLVDLVSL